MNKVLLSENIIDSEIHELNVTSNILARLELAKYQGGHLRFNIDLVSTNTKEAKTPDINVINILKGYGVEL